MSHQKAKSPLLPDIIQFLDSLLDTSSYKDAALNGLQVESGLTKIHSIAFAVDAGESIIEQAIENNCQLLIVHHGLFWNCGGMPIPLSGVIGRKVRKLIMAGCSLYASHLPLDGNQVCGNAFELARTLKMINLKPFLYLDGKSIGVEGKFKNPKKLKEVEAILKNSLGHIKEDGYYPFTLAFGKQQVQKLGIVTGSGSMAITESAANGHDLLISGEPKQEIYHQAKELAMNVIFGGHYATETFGVKALEKILKKKFKIKTLFLDEPTGI